MWKTISDMVKRGIEKELTIKVKMISLINAWRKKGGGAESVQQIAREMASECRCMFRTALFELASGHIEFFPKQPPNLPHSTEDDERKNDDNARST